MNTAKEENKEQRITGKGSDNMRGTIKMELEKIHVDAKRTLKRSSKRIRQE